MDYSTHAVVIDNGSNFIRAGVSGEDAPRCCFRSVVGRSRMPSVMIGLESKVNQLTILGKIYRGGSDGKKRDSELSESNSEGRGERLG